MKVLHLTAITLLSALMGVGTLMAQVPVLQPYSPTTQSPAAPNPVASRDSPASEVNFGKPIQAGTLPAQRKAAKLYLQGVKLLEKQEPEEAWTLLKEAVQLAPDNTTYIRASELARQSTVTQLVQQATRERERDAAQNAAGNRSLDAGAGAAALLQRALAIDPENSMVIEHLNQFADTTAGVRIGGTSSSVPALSGNADEAQDSLSDGPIVLQPKPEKHSFHTRGTERQIAQDVFRAYGIDATVHESVKSTQVRLDLDDATFPEAMRVLGLLTHTFYEPVDPHRVVVADDTRENRTQFQRLQMETVYLGSMSDKELTEVKDVAKNIFDAQQPSTQTSGTLLLRAPAKTMAAFNQTMATLEQGKGQVDIDVKVIQLAHIAARETGVTVFQQTGVYNAYSEIQSIINSNQSAIQQIIASGVVPNDTTLANQITIIGILLAAGQLSGSIFNNGVLSFGNGLTASLLSVSPATLTMSLTSSDTRMLDDIHLQLADGEDGTFKIGERYPIETSSYSSVALPAISGISATAAAAASQTVPQVEYQDIGLTLKATPKIMRSNDVALTIDLKITSLGGTSLNSIPILNSQQSSGVITLTAGETAIMASDLSSSQSRAMSGLPGIGDIPGLMDFNDIQRNQNVSRLLILVTPRVVRNVQNPANSHMLMVDKTTSSHAFN
jgi:general secretion pathway protein D